MLDGFVFDRRPITSEDWAHYNWVFSGKRDGITSGCGMTVSGNSVYVADGYFLIRGRMGVVKGTTTVTAPTVSSGQLYATLVARIDLSQTNTEETLNQLVFDIKTDQTAYPAVVQEDLDNGGSVYEVTFARFMLSVNGISNFEQVIQERVVDWISQSQISYNAGTNSLYFNL